MKKRVSRRNFIKQTGLTVGAVSVASSFSNDNPDLMNDTVKCPQRRLGRTGRMVSRIGFGGGSRYYKWVPQEKDAEKLIHYAIQLGVTYFDTSRAYGKNQESEIRYGKYLTPDYRDQIFLVSKTPDRTYDGVMHDIEASLKNLKTDYLDLYHMHAMENMKDVKALSADDGGFKAYRKLKEEGVIKHIGFSTHEDLNDGIIEAVHRFDPDVIMCALNALKEGHYSGNRNEEILLPLAKERDIAIVAMKVTGQNALIGKVSGRDLLHYSLSLPDVALANVGMDGYSTLESSIRVSNAPALTLKQRNMMSAKLSGDSGIDKLGYLEPGYVDGDRIV